MKTKSLMLVLALVGAVVLFGCKKKEEPAPAPAMEKAPTVQDVEKMAAETKEAAVETAEKATETVEAAAAAAAVEQTMCPIMDGNKIDKNVFVEYQGKKVYFCCAECKGKFEAEPEKYISKLPQFSK
jgi:YHS domain-containing protein